MTEWTDHRPEGPKNRPWAAQWAMSQSGSVCSLLRAGGIEAAPTQWVLCSSQEGIKGEVGR